MIDEIERPSLLRNFILQEPTVGRDPSQVSLDVCIPSFHKSLLETCAAALLISKLNP